MLAVFEATNNEAAYQATLSIKEVHQLEEPAVLCFSLAMPMDAESLTGGRLLERQGDFHRIHLVPDQSGAVRLSFSGQGAIKKGTDYPYGVYLEMSGERFDVELPAPRRYDTESQRPFTQSMPVFIPQCDVQAGTELMECPHALRFGEGSWNTAWLQRLFGRLSDSQKPDLAGDQESGFPIRAHLDNSLRASFKLSVHVDGARLAYRDQAGFYQGQAYLYQYLIQWVLLRRLPGCELSGDPTFSYRGIHFDVVRHFFPISDLKRWWDVMALFQFNVFHWHLTDDDGWRVQSASLSSVTDIGAWRGPDESLPPQMGTGSTRYGGSYKPADVRAFVAGLELSGVEVVPEMDLPGHARALLKSLPELTEPEDASEYRSVQHYNDNVVTPVFGQTMARLETLATEWFELFPGRLFHLGCDEVPEGAWSASPATQQSAYNTQVSTPLTYLVKSMEKLTAEHGKALAGWEEIAEGGAGESTWVYTWQGVEAGQRAAEKGHPVVMTPAQYCYLDLAVTEAFDDPGYWWAGVVDMRQAYSYEPLVGLSDKAAKNIRGVQYCLWTELVDTPEKAEFMWFPRLLAGAEVAWGSNTNVDYDAFVERADQWVQVLLRLGIGVRSKKMGW